MFCSVPVFLRPQFSIALALVLSAGSLIAQAPVTLAEAGVARLKIAAPSQQSAADELEQYLEQISGADFERSEIAERGAKAIHVGLISEFPWLDQTEARQLGDEGFVLRSDAASGQVYLVASKPAGVRHAVTTFLQRLGCRQFFPGAAWEVIPSQKTIRGSWDERSSPSFPTQRRIWYGFGAYGPGKKALADWEKLNRMGGSVAVSIGHTWHGLKAEADFAAHPDWFALVKGKRQATKPCYSHPKVLERAIESALHQAGRGQQMVSMSPPDGLGYCECERCLAVFKGAEPIREHGTLFARQAGGRMINLTSETLFAFVNRVAAAVAEKHPQVLIGCYAYSAYSHPPSFELHPNVYVQTTTSYRRTPLELEVQIEQFGQQTSQLGIREYYSVFQWDWDYPSPGKLLPLQLQAQLRFYRERGITAVNAEASNNWGPRGLGYYIAAQLMWDIDADVDALVGDFYIKAFGPAARAMQRYYVRWYGNEAAVLDDKKELPDKRTLVVGGAIDAGVLAAGFADLDEAARLVRDSPAHRARVDQLRLYLHYLALRWRLEQAEISGDEKRILAAIRAETMFGGRLTNTGMIHARPLIGKAFLRRFRKHAAALEKIPEAAKWGQGWRQVGEPPTAEELEILWKADMERLRKHTSKNQPQKG